MPSPVSVFVDCITCADCRKERSAPVDTVRVKKWQDHAVDDAITEDPELHANKLINQSLHVVDLNIDRYNMIIGRDLMGSLGIDIHGADMNIHWDDAAISCRDIYSTTNDVFALLQYNSPFNSETKGMKHILYDKYYNADIKTIAESSTHLDPQ